MKNTEVAKLFAKAAGRCSMCNIELFEDRVRLGEMAHMIAKSKRGPRGEVLFDGDSNSYENLILLCPTDHTRVDGDSEKYTIARLREIKASDVEVLRSEFDAGGYDLVLSRGKTVRHVQLKTVVKGGSTSSVNVNLKLMEKPSGCVVCIVVTPELDVCGYRWFGGCPGQALPDIRDRRVARHTKGNAAGDKLERPNIREIPLGEFGQMESLDAALARLFGRLP